jgi:hypothetical protein
MQNALHSSPQVPYPSGPADQHELFGVVAVPAAIIAAAVRQAIELPEVSPGLPAGKYLQAVRQVALSWY